MIDYSQAFFDEEMLELQILISNDSDTKRLGEIISKYPVTYNVIKNMIMCGLNVNRINDFCYICYQNSFPITIAWGQYRRFLMYGLIKEA